MIEWKTSATSTPTRRVRVKASRIGTESSVSTGPAIATIPIRESPSKVGNPNEESDWLA